MQQWVFIFLGFLGIVWTLLAMLSVFDTETRIICAGVSMVTWGIWAFGAEGGIVSQATTTSYRSLFGLGLILAVVMLLFLLRLVKLSVQSSVSEPTRPDEMV